MTQSEYRTKIELFRDEVRPLVLKLMSIVQKYEPMNDDDFEPVFDLLDSYITVEKKEEDE